ncbi:MAG: hypothetical protein HGGPFJEG_01294 [Ignavibacteria bacterium]|nr:hypothetical protein [Ignavibacteria bacterium]
MIEPKEVYDSFIQNGIKFFTGVPDSLLKDFCSYISDNAGNENHVISTNEGSAIALAAGYYLATSQPALVYMQNSGLGNSVNPILSLADSEVYGIPMILMIGWRGEPGKKDEPQHVKQGRVMLGILDAMELPYFILDKDSDNINELIQNAVRLSCEKNSPVALIVREGAFKKYDLKNNDTNNYTLSREETIGLLIENLDGDEIIISTTGKASRELYEYRERKNQSHEKDFLTVGSMGHSSQIALGIAFQKKNKKVYVIDGDGALLMHLGAAAVCGTAAPDNFRHILINNGSHESVGGQQTAGFKVNFLEMAKACGYKSSSSAETRDDVLKEIGKLKSEKGPLFLEIKVNKNSRSDLGRPTASPCQNKEIFMKYLSD